MGELQIVHFFLLRSFEFERLSVFGKHPDSANIENWNIEWMRQWPWLSLHLSVSFRELRNAALGPWGWDRAVGVDGRFTCTPQAASVYLITFHRCSLKQVFQVNAEVVWLRKVWLQGFVSLVFGFFFFPFFDCLVLACLFFISFFSAPTLAHLPSLSRWDTQRRT